MARRRPPSADPLADLTAAVVTATEELVRRDPVLARLVAAFGPCDLAGRRDLSHFGALCRSITFQQLAGRAAAKTRSIRALAERTASGELPLDDVEDIGDEELIERLSAVPGIGRWTAEMFLIFQLGRLDVWPVGDLGVRKGYATAWGLPAMPTPKELVAYGETFRPYRSVAAWYCWRAVDTVVPDSSAAPPLSGEAAAPQPPAGK